MSRQSNQDVERYYFDQFKAHYPLPSGEPEYTDKPDVIVHGHRTLGIEIANLYLADGANHGSEQVQRQIRNTALRLAQIQYLEAGGKKIELTFSFDPTRPISDPKVLARTLASLAASIEKL